MGKGGDRALEPEGLETTIAQKFKGQKFDASGNWVSRYDPLDPNAPELPTKGQIKAVIPKHCFQRSYFWSMFYLARDTVVAAAFVYATSLVLSPEIPSDFRMIPLWALGWGFYAFWMGSIVTGHWVLAHECGHGAFSPSQSFNDVVGFIVHQALLVPYFAWQYTHAKHHRRTNHLTEGESHVPSTGTENGLGENNERESFYAVLHEAMGDGAFAGFQVWTHLFIGWPLYLLGLASTGRLTYSGEPLDGAIADHFRPNSPMFPPKLSRKIFLSTVGVIVTLAGLIYLKWKVGVMPVLCWYWGPYTISNGWLVLYTWLQHTDPSVPQYGEGEWSWVKGTLSTIDRPYGIFDILHHTIGSTHVTHHLFHELPWYNADEATVHIKAFLEPKGLYNYDPTPWWKAMWRVAHTCHYVEDYRGIQYYKSLEDIPLSTETQKKKD